MTITDKNDDTDRLKAGLEELAEQHGWRVHEGTNDKVMVVDRDGDQVSLAFNVNGGIRRGELGGNKLADLAEHDSRTPTEIVESFLTLPRGAVPESRPQPGDRTPKTPVEPPPALDPDDGPGAVTAIAAEYGVTPEQNQVDAPMPTADQRSTALVLRDFAAEMKFAGHDDPLGPLLQQVLDQLLSTQGFVPSPETE